MPFDPPNYYNIKKIINSWDKPKQKDVKSIMKAYSDMNELSGPRNLDFISDLEYSLEETIEILGKAIPNGYNEFEPELLMIFKHYPTIKFRIAREGSVALYITHPKRIRYFLQQPDIIRELKVDEHWQENIGYRLWWD